MTAALGPVEREMVAAAKQAGAEAGADAAPYPRSAIVESVDPTNTVAMVRPDGPTTEAHGAKIMVAATLYPGDRVMLLYVNPHDCFVLGLRGGDMGDWRLVGDIDAPFATGWDADAGTEPPGFAGGPAVPMFTRRSGLVELRGRAERTSGSSQLVFTLPEDCWPSNDLLIGALTSLGAHTPLEITHDGEVSVASGVTFIIMDGVMWHAAIPEETS